MKAAASIKTAALVTLVTLVIWFFAESESLTSRSVRVEAAFEVEPKDDRSLRVIDPDWQQRIDTVIEGATAAVSEAETVLRRPVRFQLGAPGIPTDLGEQTVDLAAALRGLPDLQGKPVTILRADPSTVRVRIEQLATRELKVVVDAPPGTRFESLPEARPATVKISLPEVDARLLDESAVAFARISGETLSRLVPGRRETISNVAVDAPPLVAGPRTRLNPSRIDVDVTLQSRTATLTLASVPVFILVAAVEYERWDITVAPEDRFLTDVKVSGPSDLVDRVRRGEIRVTAKVELTFDELERGISSKEVVFSQMPTDLTFTADNPRVRLQIRKRENGPRN